MKPTVLVLLGCLLMMMPGTVRAQNGFPEITVRPGQRSLPPLPANTTPPLASPDIVPPAVPLQPTVPLEPLPLPPAPVYATPPLPEATTPDPATAFPTTRYSTVYPPHVDTIDVPQRPSLFRDYDDVFGGHRLWVETDYLLWWLRKAPIGVPLVTTGPFTDPTAGHLDDPLTHILLGPGGFDSSATSGGRIRAGIWIEPFLGVEFAGMLFAPIRSSQSFGSDASGIPILSRPVMIGGAEHSYDIAYPGHWNGSFSAESTTHLDGFEVNFVGFGLGPRALSMEFLAGFRYAHLGDDLDLNQSIHNQIGMLAFNRIVDAGANISVLDQYRTTNQFYGGQIGARGEWTDGPFSVALSGKLGLGVDEQTLTVNGSTHLREANGATSDYAGGILANAANIGRYQANRFAMMPELGVTFGYWITPNVRLSLGYSALYWTDVLRAGNQIDRRVNPIYVPLDMSYAPGAAVVRQPPPMLRSDFWAEGLLFGAEIRY
ncbi:MAG TPA: BBP7 family outer membrane beta-barrel protein [Gemmataceae bacterium]|nr:BBP7 family outer membrane beta-barrel protein [Gemmataceae bacterium]